MEFITEYKEIIIGALALATLIAAKTKFAKDDKWVAAAKKFFDFVFKKAEEKDESDESSTG